MAFFACNSPEEKNETTDQNSVEESKEEYPKEDKTYSNERFKAVEVEQINENEYRVTGKAQVFEATLSYAVEDGHYELAKGFTTTDAGAPEFGNFEFTFKAEKREPNTTLMLILFEGSPKDGSRTHELFIPLEKSNRPESI